MSEVLDASAVRESPPSPAPEGQNQPLPDAITHNALIRAHGIAAFTMLLLAVTFGIVASLQFFLPELTSEIASWGRLRFAHTQGIMLGWLGNAFIAFLYLAVPVLSGRPVTSEKLGWFLFGLWNFGVLLPGWLLVLNGYSQPLEWAEFPLLVDAVMIGGLTLAAIQF